MSAPARLRGALAMTGCAYAFRTGSAVLLAWPALADLARLLDTRVFRRELGAPEVALVLELAARNGQHYLLWAGGAVAGYALLSPLVSLAWLHALLRPQPVAACFARAIRAYPSALALALAALLAISTLVALAAAALAGTSFLFRSEVAETAQLALVLGAALLGWLFIATAHDLSRAALAHGLRLRSALGLGVRLTSPRLLSLHLCAAAAAAGCTLSAELFARALPHAPPALVLAAQQALVMLAVLLRGAWLALAADRLASLGSEAAVRSR